MARMLSAEVSMSTRAKLDNAAGVFVKASDYSIICV